VEMPPHFSNLSKIRRDINIDTKRGSVGGTVGQNATRATPQPPNQNQRIAYFVENNVFFFYLVQGWRTFLFRSFRIMPSTVAAFSEEPFLLFRTRTLNHGGTNIRFERSQEIVENTAASINLIREQLKRRYNMELLFVPVPDKISIYNKFVVNTEYDKFLPRLHEALDETGVSFVRLYDIFSETEEIVYFANDTHWNQAGFSLAVDVIVQQLNEMRLGLVTEVQ